MTTLQGIDVSASGQGAGFSFAPYRGKISFAWAKVSQGLSYADPDAGGNLARARAEGLVVGGYHFLRADQSGAQQAEYFLKYAHLAGLKPGDLVAVDTEDQGLNGASPAQADQQTAAFCAELRKHWPAFHAVVYTEVWLLPHLASCGSSPLWAANPGGGTIADLGPWKGGPSFEQVSQSVVDQDVFYGDLPALKRLAIPG